MIIECFFLIYIRWFLCCTVLPLKNVSVFLPNTHFLSLILILCHVFEGRVWMLIRTKRLTDVGGVINVQVM